MAATYRRGGFGYGEVKKALADLAENYFAEARERRRELVAQPKRVLEILSDGATIAEEGGGSSPARTTGMRSETLAAVPRPIQRS